MSDRDLLEKAAKAIGLDLCFNDAETPGYYSDWRGMPQWEVWNPLVHDGHAMRLAVKCGTKIEINNGRMEPFTRVIIKPNICKEEEHRDDPNAATRRAIVRAAAAITEQKEGGGNV